MIRNIKTNKVENINTNKIINNTNNTNKKTKILIKI